MSEELSLGQKAGEVLKKHGKAAALELIEELAVPALEEAAKKSETPIDDVLVAALKEPLKQAMKDAIQKI